ncbi:hypothetical protein [Ruminococcus sp. Marseille-P6503]|uniref:hypothetical protein n=1 Tax=Ruminococcus sp. Marseille-P6503 TaxID=2364796 RepID=UPI000F538DD8|nr:hypothetical protein [Ruminococcus sp. Marseille-P6503]
MKTGKITAKLRDAVPVCLMVNGEEVKRYKNIELPDMLKEVEMTDFHFNVHMDGKITFEIHYEEGVLPEVFPEARTRVSRAAKTAAKAAMQQPAEDEAAEAIEASAVDEPEDNQPIDEPQAENPGEPTTEETEAEGIEAAYNVTGIRRKELVVAVGDFIGAKPEYLRAPTYAFAVGSYNIDKEGTLTGPENPALIESLKEQGFVAAE